MGVVFDFLYRLSLSIVRNNGSIESSYTRKRAHRAVIILSYMLGLWLSSSALYAVAWMAGTSEFSILLFVVTFVLGLFSPYFILVNLYLTRGRFEQVAIDANLSKDRFYFVFLYIACHVGFMLILYSSSLIGRN